MIVKSRQLPTGDNFIIKDTVDTGRALFALADVAGGSHLLTTSSDISPISHVILRLYRKEVCTQCFKYDRGREWKLRDMPTGSVFCTLECQSEWKSENDLDCMNALLAVEAFAKAQKKRQSSSANDPENANTTLVSDQGIQKTWRNMEDLGRAIIRARTSTKPTKAQRAILRSTNDLTVDPDILSYVMSGVLTAHKARSRHVGAEVDMWTLSDLLPSLYQLAPDDRVFVVTPTTSSPLHDYSSSYLILLAIMPISMLHLVKAEFVVNLASRASHNAFSIRPEGMTDGDQSGEFLGWGVWPEASFFNHSCRPNVKKERKGRKWSFCVDVNLDGSKAVVVQTASQLCITYLGGDERDLDVVERRKRLQEQWEFTCMCQRCIEESDEMRTTSS